MNKISTIDIKNAIISITKIEEEDYICLTDMAKAKEGDNRAADVIKNWIRTRTTNNDLTYIDQNKSHEVGGSCFILSPFHT